MKKNIFKLLGIIAIMAIIVIAMASCTTNVPTAKATNFDKNPLSLIGNPSYSVLGPVLLEKDWRGILGISTPSIGPIPGTDLYFFQTGGITYSDLLQKAQEKYPNADAVIDIKVDYSRSSYWIFFSKRIIIITGIAIKYSREEVKDKTNGGSVNVTF